MEAGSIPGGPAGAPVAQPQPVAPTSPAPAVAPASTDPAAQPQVPGALPQAPTPPAPAQPEAGSIESQLAAMEARAEAAEAQLQGQGDPAAADLNAEGEQDLISLLLGEDPEAPSAEQIAAQQPGAEGELQSEEAQLQELRNFVREEAEQIAKAAVDPILQERQDEQLNALAEKYPDITSKEIFSKIGPALQNLEQELGVENARLSPRLVEMTYKAVKAETADAAAAPAEQAANHGASIETQAGQTPQGEASLDDQYANALKTVSTGGSEFD